MKYLSILVVFVLLVGCKNGEVIQDVREFDDKGYTISTFVWYKDNIVWCHFTWQEERMYIPLDSISVVKKRDYDRGIEVLNNYRKYDIK